MTNTNLPQIAYGDLIERLSDPDQDLDHYLQYMIEVPVPGATTPELEPNPSLVTEIPPRAEGGVGMGLANWFMRKRRHRAYRKRINDGWNGHRIVSEGDSWFQYPTKLQDIIDHLMKDHAILSLGAAGDELEDIQQQREILVNIQAERASALLLSAGGNDLFDNGQLGTLIEPPFPGATADDLVGATLDAFLAGIQTKFLALFRRVHGAAPHVHILIHGYGPAFPRDGAWIEKPLTKAGVPSDIQHDIVKIILRKFNATLSQIAGRSEFHGKIKHLDVTNIGKNPGDWHDEIHLNGPNAAKVAERFRKELRKRLTGPAPESGLSVAPAAASTLVSEQAESLSALDEPLLLRELDLRVGLLEMDPSVADEAELAPLVIGRAEPEIGITSLRSATRRFIRNAEADLHDLICGGAAESEVDNAILGAIDKGNKALSGAIAGWLVTGPLGVPAVIAGALAAWLATKLGTVGRDKICMLWKHGAPAAPAVLHGAVEGQALTMGEMRAKFKTPKGEASFTKAGQKDQLDRLSETLAKEVVEVPSVPVDADGAKKFKQSAATIFKMLGGEPDDVPLSPENFGTAEAMVAIDGSRVAMYVRDGFVDIDDPKLLASGWRDEVVAHEAELRNLIACSGRVIRGSDRSANQVYGSAWMLEGGRVATARHVLEAMAIEVAGEWHLKDVFFVDFAVEADRGINANAVFKITGVDWASPTEIAGTVDPRQLDAAVLTLEPVAGRAFPDHLALSTKANGQAITDAGWFFNVGHPGQPFGSWLVDTEDGNSDTISKALVFALIGDKFGVKRMSPGRIDFAPGKFPNDDNAHVFTHDATTLGGSSGSAILSMTGGPSICGLHFAGLFGTRNYAHFIPAIRDNW